jgi:hypothetical protein
LISKDLKSEKKKPLIVQFHGNAQNMSAHYLSLKWLVEKGHDLFIFDYQGYGPSHGSPSPENLRDDALNVLEYVESELISGEQTYIAYGQSLGGNVLADALIHKNDHSKILTVIIDSSFPSYREIAEKKLRSHWASWVFWPLTYLLVDDSTNVTSKMKALEDLSVLFIVSGSDTVVPAELSKKFF